MKGKILYVEDMTECFEKINSVLSGKYDIDWRNDYLSTVKAIYGEVEYDLAVVDVNLSGQEKEGLELITLIEESLDIPIICVSRQNHKKEAREKGADLFVFKKFFFENAERIIYYMLKNGK